MDRERKFTRLVDDAVAQSLTGWDFSYVNGRIVEADTSWNFRDLVEQRMSQASAALDMCTGGGEFLNSFKNLPPLTYATEGFSPNIPVARQRLAKRGVSVVEVTSDKDLPLPGRTFDLVINRHGAYSPKELLRVMKPPGAIFLSQQVGSDNASGLNEILGAASPGSKNWRLDTAASHLSKLGFIITRGEEEFPIASFKDIGAVVFYLQAIPWQIPDFNVASSRAALLALHDDIESNGSFDTKIHRFLIEAQLT